MRAGPVAPWDYLIVTASNAAQARAYESQLAVRRNSEILAPVREVIVVADPEGRRVGSGGSTVYCLFQILQREWARHPNTPPNLDGAEQLLRRLRILIVHAGGDSRRLPAYGPCGKLFVPVPRDDSDQIKISRSRRQEAQTSSPKSGRLASSPPNERNLESALRKSEARVALTLFDRLLPTFLNLPAAPAGQVVVTSGDALLLFDARSAQLDKAGLTALGCLATPEAASKHGVFCPHPDGRIRLYLQKPKPEEQARQGAVNSQGQSILDIGVMSFDAQASAALLRTFGVGISASGANDALAGRLQWSGPMHELILAEGLDLYREICCALGTEATPAHHFESAHASGSGWAPNALAEAFRGLCEIPFHIEVLPHCHFLHFGTTRQLITSGQDLVMRNAECGVQSAESLTLPPGAPVPRPPTPDTRRPLLSLNNAVLAGGAIVGTDSWVEGCRLSAPLTLGGRNVMVGLDVEAPLELPPGACIDVLSGLGRTGQAVWFLRIYGVDDGFKDAAERGATFCNQPILRWLAQMGAQPEDIWEPKLPAGERSLWNARISPAAERAGDYRHWLWLYEPATATTAQKAAFLKTDRYSSAEITTRADQEAFYERRRAILRMPVPLLGYWPAVEGR